MIATDLIAIASVTAVVAVAIAGVLGYFLHRQGRKLLHRASEITRLSNTICDLVIDKQELRDENEDLAAENTVIRGENADLRDQIDRLNRMAIDAEVES